MHPYETRPSAPSVELYHRTIESAVDRAYAVAEAARREGMDPEVSPEIPRARDMAMRVEKLLAHLGIEGISEEIRARSREMPREEVAVTIARRLASDTSRGASVAARVDAALRVGLAILTEGILVAPLEGLAEVHICDGPDRTQYIELYYAGPIRAAGGTAQALSVLLADIVRRDLGLAAFRPDPAEVERYKEEIPLYKYHQHLQYVPTPEEIELVVRNVPVAISGESTEGDAEVSAFRNLGRVPTNGIRGGACLVIAEGLCQKAPKLRKIVEKLGLDGWEFLAELGLHTTDDEEARTPKYLQDSVGGRPVLAHPNHPGGFRLTYGRARTTGLAACAINPATMVILQHFVAIGTQVKLEYPGKASAMGVCDTIEGPIVELDDGTVTAVHDVERAEALRPRVHRIVDLGEILVSFGEFLENNRALVPGTYSLDWHLEELREAAGIDPSEETLGSSYADAVALGRRHHVPLHPRWLLFWHDLTSAEIRALGEFVERTGRWVGDAVELPADPSWHAPLCRLGFLSYPIDADRVRGEPDSSAALVGGLGLVAEGGLLVRATPLEPVETEPLAYVSRLAGVEVRARAPSRVGGRVGRPEKAYQRSMQPNVHGLFPVGAAGGPTRSLPEAARRTMREGTPVDLGVRSCPACGRTTVWNQCPCGAHTQPTGDVATQALPIARLWSDAVNRLHLGKVPVVKGVKGLTSPGKVPEPIEKGILRASHGISVYQDGTARFDLTDLPLTHFRPAEVGADLAVLGRLGYDRDWTGAPLTDPEQLVELAPQDVVVSRSCGEYLTRLAQFVDDELVRIYNLDPFYRADRPEDLIGQVVVALAPHTSGGVAGRLVGFTDAEACFAHPVFHAAKRRNCDGDEDSVTLLLDALLNFSRSYLPESRGALMDKPLVLTTRLEATEVDKEAHNVDVAAHYPLALYRAAAERRPAKEVEPLLELVGHRLGSDRALSGYGFTHDTARIAGGPVRSAYRDGRSMTDMVERSIVLATQIRAVDVAEAVTLVLNAHFLPDVMGNLKSYATQRFRCKECGASYRRPPLAGRCAAERPGGARCDGELLSTVYEASVRKYLPLSQRLGEIDGITPYVRQRIQVLADSVATLFPGATAQTTLDRFQPRARAHAPGGEGDAVAPPPTPI
jgi:DNA polymerase II large subunit